VTIIKFQMNGIAVKSLFYSMGCNNARI